MKITSEKNLRKNVLIIGASGFIGKNIFEVLSRNHLFSVSTVSLEEIDLTNCQALTFLNSYLGKKQIVVMSAAITRDRGDTIENMMENIKMASNLASIISESSISHLIYISTVDVYGRKDLKLPLNELSKLQPSDYYSISKLSSELILGKTCFDNQIPLAILRLPGVYGPDDTHNSPIKVFINSTISGKTITVAGDGSQLRDFIYINDISEIVKNICIYKIIGTYNIVSGKSYSINEVIDMISEILKRKPNIVYEKNYNKKLDLVFSESHIKKIFPSFKFTDLKEGIKQTYNFYSAK